MDEKYSGKERIKCKSVEHSPQKNPRHVHKYEKSYYDRDGYSHGRRYNNKAGSSTSSSYIYDRNDRRYYDDKKTGQNSLHGESIRRNTYESSTSRTDGYHSKDRFRHGHQSSRRPMSSHTRNREECSKGQRSSKYHYKRRSRSPPSHRESPNKQYRKRSLSPNSCEIPSKRPREDMENCERSRRQPLDYGSSRRNRRSRSPLSSTRCSSSKSTCHWDHLQQELEKDKADNELLESIMSASSSADVKDESSNCSNRWVQSSSKENCYTMSLEHIQDGSTLAATKSLQLLLQKFQSEILEEYVTAKREQPDFEIPFSNHHHHHHHHHHHEHSDNSSSSGTDSEQSDEEKEETTEAIKILKLKEKHPARLAKNLWYNDKGQLNDRPVCRCSVKAQKFGIRHNIFPGEIPYPLCDKWGNNLKNLHHYTVQISPCTNFIFRYPTVIKYDQQEFFFEGFSVFSHVPLDSIPPCNVIRFSIEYTITLVNENPPENFVIQELDMFSDYLFTEILELYDFDHGDTADGCRRFHFMPRFARLLPNNGKEILSMHQVMSYLLKIRKPVITEDKLADILKLDVIKWTRFTDFMNDMIVTCPGKKPSSVRCDQVDRDQAVYSKKSKVFPLIIHAGVMPTQLTYAADPRYKKLFKSFLRMRHLLLNRSRASQEEQQSYINIQNELAKIRRESYSPKEVNSEVPCNEAIITGIRSDVCQHALMMPVLVNYLRYYICLDKLNEKLGNIFTDKVLLKHAMTHPSYRLTFGMNSDHIRNSLYNCGNRQPEFGDKNWQSSENRKKGIVNLVKIMSRLAEEEEVTSNIHHYERLEFLGDAVVEFITTTTLYHLFPDVEEGGLAVYRQALVENQHLAKLAKKLQLEHYMLYSHGPDLCRDQDLRHALANCLEAVMGAIYLEKGIEEARRVFSAILFDEDEDLRHIWANCPKHPLQRQFPEGDRHMIEDFPVLQKMTEFEERTGMTFKHIRLLARAFTQRTVGYNELTLGHNQRMEFLGDSVLQLVVSTYLFKHFPEHHEGHLSLLRSCLVNNRTQSIICQDLGLEDYMLDDTSCRSAPKSVPMKQQADLLEALLGAMYVDRGLDVVEAFCNVCFFPRLREFIIEQDWNDDKSKLQQVVLTLRKEGAEQPDIPHYKVLKKSGPTNASVYTVAVFFKGKRIGVGSAESVRLAEKMAAKDALSKGEYEQIKFQAKLMSSLYPDEYKPPEISDRKVRQRKPTLPKQYADSTRNKRKKDSRR